uniref:Uncharacterized protein n=1 Tax=Panagrolaimus sp. ES5 TaxID=591445 RepID=A0AC34GUS3_9BILA
MKNLIRIGSFAVCFLLSVHGFDIPDMAMPSLEELRKWQIPIPGRIERNHDEESHPLKLTEEEYRKLQVPKPVKSVHEKEEELKHHPSCLILSISNILKEHISPENVNVITVLFQHSLESCPGLNSTFEILQKIMKIKEMNLEKALEFVQNFGKPTASDVDEIIFEKERKKFATFDIDPEFSRDPCKFSGILSCKKYGETNEESSAIESKENNDKEVINGHQSDKLWFLSPPPRPLLLNQN